MLTLFLFGTFWFWSLLIIASIALVVCLEKDNDIRGATIAFIGALAAILFLGNLSWLSWILENPLQIGLLVMGYLVIGVGWGIAKWWIYLHDVSTRNRTERIDWLKKRLENLKPTTYSIDRCEAALEQGYDFQLWPPEVKKDWEHYVKMEYNCNIKQPMVSDNKSRITGWMTYWPWSALWTLINDPVRRFYRWAYTQLHGLLQGMSDKAFKGIDK